MARKSVQKKTDSARQLDNLISIRDVQARLGVSRSTVMRLKENVPHYRIGDRVLFDWSDVQSYLATHCRVEPSPRKKPHHFRVAPVS